MLSKKTMDAIAAIMGIEADVLATAISDEQESDISLPEGRFLKSADEITLLDNHGKRKYDEGKGKGLKEGMEALGSITGIEFDTSKVDDFVSKYKSSVLEEAKIEPNKKITELQTSIEALQGKIAEKDTAYTQLEGSIKKKEVQLGVQSLIPELPESLGLTKQEATSLFFMTHEIKEDGVYKDGVKLKDELQNDLTKESAVASFVSSRGWASNPSGRGGGAGGSGGTKTGKIQSMEDYESVLKERGLNVGGEEANAILMEAAKENPSLLD